MNRSHFFLLVFAGIAFQTNAQTVSFYREKIEMKLDPAHLSVKAEYYYRNSYNSELTQTLFVPISPVSGNMKVDTFSIFDETQNVRLSHCRRLPAGLFFQVNFHPLEQKKIRISYVMDHDGRYARYLVMTHANYWKRPALQGTYSLEFEDPALKFDSASYKPDKTTISGEKTTLLWQKLNFKPDRELEFWFHLQK